MKKTLLVHQFHIKWMTSLGMHMSGLDPAEPLVQILRPDFSECTGKFYAK